MAMEKTFTYPLSHAILDFVAGVEESEGFSVVERLFASLSACGSAKPVTFLLLFADRTAQQSGPVMGIPQCPTLSLASALSPVGGRRGLHREQLAR